MIPVSGLFVKVLGKFGRKLLVSSFPEFRDAVNELGGEDRKLTFAFYLPFGHHCTISFINGRSDEEMFAEAQRFFATLAEHPITAFRAVGTDKFADGKINVILLDLGSEQIYDAFQRMSQVGTQEGPTPIRTPHMSYWLDGDEEKIVFLQSVLAALA